MQCFLFQNKIKYFFDTLLQKICFQIKKIHNFRVELTDNSAKKEALVMCILTMIDFSAQALKEISTLFEFLLVLGSIQIFAEFVLAEIPYRSP